MAEVPVEIKKFELWNYGEVLVPNPDGSYITSVHLHGNTFQNKPNILNASTNAPVLIQQRGAWPNPITYVAVDPKPGFRYIIPISDTPVPEFTPAEFDKFLTFIDFNNGVISAHSYGVARMMQYFAWPERKHDFQAAVDISGYNDGSVKSLPKLNFKVKFYHAADDKIVPLSQTKNYQSLLQQSGNQLEPFMADGGGNHDLGRVWMNGPKADITFDWIKQQIKPVTPQPQPDQVYPAFYNATGKYFFITVDGKEVKI